MLNEKHEHFGEVFAGIRGGIFADVLLLAIFRWDTTVMAGAKCVPEQLGTDQSSVRVGDSMSVLVTKNVSERRSTRLEERFTQTAERNGRDLDMPR